MGRRHVRRFVMKIGVFFSTTTGSKTEIAGMMKQVLGDEADGPKEIDEVGSEEFMRYDKYAVGTPTWNTDADVKRHGTSWDAFLYGDLKEMDLKGKVGVFELGDAVGYGDIIFVMRLKKCMIALRREGRKWWDMWIRSILVLMRVSR